MAEALGIGMTHYPLLMCTDDQMASLLSWTLTDPGIPAHEKDPENWPRTMREEWSNDAGAKAAAQHRNELVANLARIRKALDDFRPDVLVVWGDDQYENFREEVVPPFCVLAYDDLQVHPFGILADRKLANAWDRPDDTEITLHGSAEKAKKLADALISHGFDMAYSYRKREGVHFPHAILNTQVFLDYEHYGSSMPYPIIAITVNCYGEHAIARRGGLARFADIEHEQLDPSGPTPARCLDLGRGVARAMSQTDLRVAYVASSSWSHAFLNDKAWHLRPDTEADRALYRALVDGDRDAWRSRTAREIVDAGQHEMLNWFCLLGAVDELSLHLKWSTFVETDIFNSNKSFAVYGGEN